jgi:hypothetical protein
MELVVDNAFHEDTIISDALNFFQGNGFASAADDLTNQPIDDLTIFPTGKIP